MKLPAPIQRYFDNRQKDADLAEKEAAKETARLTLIDSDKANGITRVTKDNLEDYFDFSENPDAFFDSEKIVGKAKRVDLSKLRFDGLEIRHLDFSGCDLTDSSFKDCSIEKSNFDDTISLRTIFNHVHFIDASFENANCTDANFRSAYNFLINGLGEVAPPIKESQGTYLRTDKRPQGGTRRMFENAVLDGALFGVDPKRGPNKNIEPEADGTITARIGPATITFGRGRGFNGF